MKNLINSIFGLILLIIPFRNGLIAQQKTSKPSIDTTAVRSWPSLGGAKISNDGNYVFYSIENVPIGSQTLVIQSSNGKWTKEIPNVLGTFQCTITNDSKYVIYKTANDSIGIFSLSKRSVEYISNATSFKTPENGTGEWLAYQTLNKEVHLKNLKSKNSKVFDSVDDFEFNINGNILLIKSRIALNGKQTLTWINLSNSKATIIYEGKEIDNVVFDNAGKQLAFTATNVIDDHMQKTVYCYKEGGNEAKELINEATIGLQVNLKLNSINKFSSDNGRLFLSLKQNEAPAPKRDGVKVTIWSYTDTRLQSAQQQSSIFNDYLAVLNLEDKTLIRLQNKNESLSYHNSPVADFEIVYSWEQESDFTERNWNKMARRDVYLVSTKDGSRKLIRQNTLLNYMTSPKGKFLVSYDPEFTNYFSYEVETGKRTNITSKIKESWLPANRRPEMDNYSFQSNIHLAGWSYDDNSIFLYNHNDIWKVDLEGLQEPVNITNGYGRKNNIQFTIAVEEDRIIASDHKRLLLNSYNLNNKENGFYNLDLTKHLDPIVLSTGPYVYHLPTIMVDPKGFQPLKAKFGHMYLVARMSATQAPNYFTTTDFGNFIRLSSLNPHEKYNWLTSELHQWIDDYGISYNGVLFKPEDFDPNKIYPLIFYYYEKVSDLKNIYIKPETSTGPLNISWFVSNGYLVFTPDIYYEFGEPGQSALKAVTSATKYLSSFPFINKDKLGLQGFSFGGFETNYIVSHSNLFSAACSGAGPTDLISYSGLIERGGNSRQDGVANSQLRMKYMIWERPDLYVKNSASLNAHNVMTPLLLMNNSIDDAVPLSQALELFTALRRLQKPCWLLEYGEGNHGVQGKSSIDFTIRMQQFFDFYLRDKPAPLWMIDGVPAQSKGIRTGLELDTRGRKPGSVLLIENEKRKSDNYSKIPLEEKLKLTDP